MCTVIDVLGTALSARGPAAIRRSQKSLSLNSNTEGGFLIEFFENCSKGWVYDERHKKQEGKETECPEQDEESGGVK